MELKTDIDDLRRKRFFKVKKPSRKFICALCESPRQMKYKKNLDEMNYIQIAVLSAFLSWALYPFMGAKALSLVFILWPSFEVANKLLYRKEIPCPYCGFDATWYRRDVKVAKQKVEQFWSEKLPNKSESSLADKSEPTPSQSDNSDQQSSNDLAL